MSALRVRGNRCSSGGYVRKITTGNRDTVAIGLYRFVCGKEVVEWKLIYNPQGRIDAFGLYEDLKMKTGQL